MSVSLAPSPVFQGIGPGGLAAINGTLSTFIAGTSTPQVTYVDSTQTTPNANPIQLNANGQCNLWLVNGLTYKLQLKDAFGNQIWVVDQIPGGLSTSQILAIITQSFLGSILYPQTAVEMSLGITPTNLYFPGGQTGFVYPDRYATNALPGTTDMTTAINTAGLVAAQNLVTGGRGNTVQFLPTVYGVSASVNVKSYCAYLGTYGETTLFGAPADSGTKLLWIGANTSTYIMSCFDARLYYVEGFVLDAQVTNTLVNGILVDSNNNPSSSQNEFYRISIRNCLLGVQWGTSGLSPANANDGTRFNCFTIWSAVANSGGFVINSGNAGQDSIIESGGVEVAGIGINIIVSNYLQIKRVFGGTNMFPAFIQTETPFGILIEGCSSEGWGLGPWPGGNPTRASDSNFLLVNAFAGSGTQASLWQPITLIQNQINNPIVVNYPARIISYGDTWGQCLSAVDHVTTINATGTFNNSLGAGFLSRCNVYGPGVNPGSIDVSTGPLSSQPTQGWMDSAWVDLTIDDSGLGMFKPSFLAGSWTANAAMTWTVTSPPTFSYTIRNRVMTIHLDLTTSTIGGTPDTTLKVLIPGAKVPSTTERIPFLFTNGATTNGICIANINSTSNQLTFTLSGGGNWSAGGCAISGQIEFEVT